MKATRYYKWECKKLVEWRVAFDCQYLQLDEYRAIRNWVEENLSGVWDKTYRISADAGYAAFDKEEDAMLTYVCFQSF